MERISNAFFDWSPGVVRRFSTDRAGSFATLFAVAAPVIVLGVAVAINLSNAATYKQELQAAADSAALVATTAMVNGTLPADAQTIGQNFFASNAPAYNPNAGSLNIYTGELNGTASTTVSYQTRAFPTIMGKVIGADDMTIMVNSTSQASIVVGGGSNNMTYAGVGSIWGDPHLTAADGTTQFFTGCASTPPTWYNALSDSGIEVNIACAYDSYFVGDGIVDFSVMVGSHVIGLSGALATVTTAPDGTVSVDYSKNSFTGGVTIDGVYHPPIKGVQTYFGGLVTVNVEDPTNPADSNNNVVINYTTGKINYQLTLAYDYWQLGALSIVATNAGLCGVPGGIWGQTLAGVDNLAISANQVASATSTTFQYNWSICAPQAAIAKTAHLTQ